MSGYINASGDELKVGEFYIYKKPQGGFWHGMLKDGDVVRVEKLNTEPQPIKVTRIAPTHTERLYLFDADAFVSIPKD